MSSISSVEMGTWRSEDQAGYGTEDPGMSAKGPCWLALKPLI